MADTIRVPVADDHTIFRAGVRLLLKAEPDIDVVGEALDGNEGLALAELLRPDVILMDIAAGHERAGGRAAVRQPQYDP